MMQTGDEMVIFDCDCGCEALEISTIDLEKENTVYLSLWERGYGRNKKMRFWERLRFACYVLRTGRNHGDQICLERARAQSLVSFLQEKLGPVPAWTITSAGPGTMDDAGTVAVTKGDSI